MIRINLLGAPKPKNKRGSAVASAPAMEFGEVGSPMVKILLALVLAIGFSAGGTGTVLIVRRKTSTQKRKSQNSRTASFQSSRPNIWSARSRQTTTSAAWM